MRVTFGNRVVQMRLELGIRETAALARRVGISQPSMRAIEEGDTDPVKIKIGTFMRLVEALQTNPTYLWTGRGPRTRIVMPTTEEDSVVALYRGLTEEHKRTWLAMGELLRGMQPRPLDPPPVTPRKPAPQSSRHR